MLRLGPQGGAGTACSAKNLPDVISVDPGDEHFPLVIIDE